VLQRQAVPTPKRTRTFSARFSAEVIDKLDAQSERLGQSKARIAERLIEEGLRLEEFPGVAFRSGPTGRRAGIAGGHDVWEIIRDLKGAAKENPGDPIGAVRQIAGIDRTAVDLAASYYAAYPDEVDERIAADQEAADRLRAALGVAAAA
jgi:predicted transcriptional regulator